MSDSPNNFPSNSPSNFPNVPPPPQQPRSSSVLTGKRLAILVVAGVVVVSSAAAIMVSQHNSNEREARNAALYQDYVAGKLPASAYQTTTTTTDANGNVSTVTEDPGAGNTQDAYAQAMAQVNGQEAVLPESRTNGSVQRISLSDESAGFQNALSLSIPAGWRYRGDLVRNVPCSPGDAYPELNASSPDGDYSLTVMTPFFTTSQPTNFDLRTCGTVAPLSSTANILSRFVVPALRRGAQVSAPEALPDGQNLFQAVMMSGMLPGGPSNGSDMSGDTARVHVSYTQDGKSFEEYIVGITDIARRGQGGVSSTLVEIYRAPAGKLDSFYAQTVANLRPSANPEWQQRSSELAGAASRQAQYMGNQQRAAILQQGQDGGAAGRAMLARTRDNIRATGQASMDNAARSEAARHSGAVGTADYVGDRPTQTYFFCNSSGQYRTNNNPNSPGPGWYPCQR